MALEAAFQDFCEQCKRLRDVLHGVRLTVVEDKPLAGDNILVDEFGNAIEDLLERFEEIYATAVSGRQAATHPLNIDGARQARTSCQEQFNRLMQQFSFGLASYERLTELTRFGRERGGEWNAWAGSVKEALAECQQPLCDVTQALCRCWQESTERVGMTSILVPATSLGQKVTGPHGPRGPEGEIP